MTNEQEMIDDQEMTIALLGIAATKESPDEVCPPDNLMSALIENRVNRKTRAKMLSHLNRCEDCYLVWEQLGAYSAQENVLTEENVMAQENVKTQENVQVVKPPKVKNTGLIQRFENCFNAKFFWQTAASGLAVASLALALIVNLPDSPDQAGYSDLAMAVATVDADVLARSIEQLAAPWENQTFGFNNASYTIPAKAVGAGIWNARSTLLNVQDPLPVELHSEPAIVWQDSQWYDYYALGQWTLSAWILVNAENIEQSQWELLSEALQTLEARFKQRQQAEPEATIALQSIHKMQVSLERLAQKQDLSAQRILLRDIKLGMQKIFL